jgi:hypothetical protein
MWKVGVGMGDFGTFFGKSPKAFLLFWGKFGDPEGPKSLDLQKILRGRAPVNFLDNILSISSPILASKFPIWAKKFGETQRILCPK